MAHERIAFPMPAPIEVVFDDFHYQAWRARWDSLPGATSSFPFAKWAASMKHEPAADGQSVMIYTYTIETGPAMLRWLMEPVVSRIFERQARRRFACMREFLLGHRAEVEAWQHDNHGLKG